MPPKKNVDNITEPATKPKAPRKRKPTENEEKPKFKTPSATKIKQPSIKTLLEKQCAKKIKTPECSAASKRKTELANEVSPILNQGSMNRKIKSPKLSVAAKRKLDLANEVALAQLKQPKLVNQLTVQGLIEEKDDKKKVNAPAEDTTVVTTTRRPRRPPKKFKPAVLSEHAHAEEPAVVPDQRRVILKRKPRTKKSGGLSEDAQTEATNKRKADSTSTPIVEPPILKTLPKAKRCTKKNVVKPTVENDETPVINIKPKIKRRGKANLINSILTTDAIIPPSVLEKTKKVLKKDMEGQPQKAETDAFKQSPANSRKTSISECFSWTKDISSSSTTTCLTVTSNDIVVIDKKLPVLQLSHIDSKLTNSVINKIESDESSSESSSSSSSSCSSSSSSNIDSSRQSPTPPPLNLSISSISPTKSDTPRNNDESNVTKEEDWEQKLKNLSVNLKKLDIESINWIRVDRTINIVQDKILKLLKFENDVLRDCECIKQHFRPENIPQNSSKTIVVENVLNVGKDTINNELVSYSSKSEDDGNFTTSQSKYVMFDQSCADEEDPLKPPSVCGDNAFSPDKPNYDSYNNDDDDALSLFAESLTGIESSRFNSSANSVCANASEIEEYVPQPTTQIYKRTNYVPTRIEDNEATQNLKSKTICEKQNADSTSIYKYTGNRAQNNAPQNQTSKDSPALIQVVNRHVPLPKLKPMQGVKSSVFRGVCFYNLISNCKKIRCAFPHTQPDNLEIRNRLSKLIDTVFIQEYMLLRCWPTLRRWYGICYVNECIERKLTRLLVEMVIDFTSKAKVDSKEDAEIKINVTERALLYLNDVDLEACADLLKHNFGKGVLLCDVLMQTIGETQNFSRFKAVFVKLISFIAGIDRTFQLDVVNQIFERVCILPCEKPLALAVLAIINNTDPKIFNHPMMLQFEKQLSSLDLALYGKLCRLREQADVTRAQTSRENMHSPRISQEVEHSNVSLMHTSERDERYTSPDTTKMDSLNKQQDATAAAPQVVKLIRPSAFNHLFNRNPSPSYECMENNRVPKFRTWRGHQNYTNMQMNNQGGMNMGSHFPRPMRPPMRPNLKRYTDQRNVVFGAKPPKFPRRPGPDFF